MRDKTLIEKTKMSEDWSIEEVISNKPGVESVQELCYGNKEWIFSKKLLDIIIENPNLGLRPVDLMLGYKTPVLQENAVSKDDLSIKNSYFFNTPQNVCPVHEIPGISTEKFDDNDTKMESVFKCTPMFKFGGIPFSCSHKIPWEWGTCTGDPKPDDKYRFEMLYGIKLDSVYISLNELRTVASFQDVFSEIDDFFIVGTHNGKILTIFDNDMDYSANGSYKKTECHFNPVVVLDRGVPVKYIKTADDSQPFEHKQIPERKYEYDLQRKQVLHKLGEVFQQTKPNDNCITGYPTEIDFIVKTGLHEFTLLSYDRFKNNGDFWITNIRYNTDGTDPKTIINKCDYKNLQQNINAIQRARANHFNKMYTSKVK